MVGIDLRKSYSTYFNREFGNDVKFMGTKKFCFPLPISPKVLKLIIKSNDCNVSIEKIEKAKLMKGQLWLREDEHKFMLFAYKFAVRCAECSEGMYSDDDDKFYINFQDELYDADGRLSSTPARISRSTGVIEINRIKFLSYSIPMRIVILLHEFMHWRIKTRIELEADFNALNIFLKSGFPKTEALYAFTRIFGNKKHLVERQEEIFSFIKNFKDFNPCV